MDPSDGGAVADVWPVVLKRLCQPRIFWSLFAVLAICRMWTAWSLNLAEDEAYYWVWSRNLAWSYFDHPPMVAWMIRASTSIFGESEGAIRLPGVMLSLASVPVMMWGLRPVSEAAARLAGLIVLCSPGPALSGTIITPDAPVWFFGCAAMACAARACAARVSAATAGPASSPRGLWLLFGACLGLAMLSKYTAGLLGPCVAAGLASHPEGRTHLKTVWFWLAAMIAAAMMAPVLAWNAQHNWVSFRFQFQHAFAGRGVVWWRSAGDFVGGVVLGWTPPLFVATAASVDRALRQWRATDAISRVWVSCLILPLALFVYSATQRRVEVNWPLLLCIPASALTAMQMVRGPAWVRACGVGGVGVALGATLLLQLPPAINRAAERVRILAQLHGYRELAAEVDRLAAGGAVFANRYQDASLLTYYRAKREQVWTLNLGWRDNAFTFFGGRRGLEGLARAVLVNVPEQHLPAEWKVTHRADWPTKVGSRIVRQDSVCIVERPQPAAHP